MSRTRGPSGISVIGRGTVAVVPDTMRLVLGVSVHRDSVAAARADAARLTGDIAEAVRASGVAAEDVQTAAFGVHPEYRHTERRRLLDGYRVTSTLDVRVRDLDRAGDAIDAAIAAGGNDVVVDHVAFEIEDDDAPTREARARAWRDARRRAEQLAELSSLTLGDAVWVAEAGGSNAMVPHAAARMAIAEAATPIEAGTTQIAVTLEVRFAIGD